MKTSGPGPEADPQIWLHLTVLKSVPRPSHVELLASVEFDEEESVAFDEEDSVAESVVTVVSSVWLI